MPRVSVVLPNFNYARYLKERIRSILSQTETDIELLYLDDASTDESNQIAEQFAGDPRMKLTLFTENSGAVYKRWNDGARMATGDWLWFAGADDSAHPAFLETLLAGLEQNPGAGIAHCKIATIDSAGRLLAVDWLADPALQAHMSEDYRAEGHDEAVRLTAGCFLSSASAMLLNREAFLAAGAFDVRLWSAADWHLYLSMLLKCGITYSAKPLVYYRAHQATVTKKTKAAVRGVEDAYCVASMYLSMLDDDRFDEADKKLVMRRVKARVFDLLADPEVTIPESLRFAAETVARVSPDPRLSRALSQPV